MKTGNSLIHAALALAFATTAGCAAYRVESNIEEKPAPAAATAPAGQVLLSEGNLPGRKYSEIGPVEGTTFLHGYTSAFGIFRPRRHSEV